MSDENEELKRKIAKLEEKIEELEKKIEQNSEKDKKHHKELKELQHRNLEKQSENLTWNRLGGIGAIATPILLPIILPLINRYLRKQEKENDTKAAEPSNKKSDINALTELLKEVRKTKDGE